MMNMYIEVSKTRYKVNLLYYIIRYNGEYAVLTENNKDYADLKDIPYEKALKSFAKVLNDYCAEFKDMIIYTNEYNTEQTLEFLKDLTGYLYMPIDIKSRTLQEEYELPKKYSIFDIYTQQFTCTEYMTKLNMIDCLLSQLITKRVLNDYQYGVLLYNLTTNKGYELLSCVCVKITGKVEILWSKQIMFKAENEYVAFNNFRRDMLTELQELGVCKDNLLTLATNEASLGEYKKLCDRTEQHRDINEQNFMDIIADCLPDTFKGIVGSSLSKLLTLIVGKVKSKHTLTAYAVGNILETLSNTNNIKFSIVNNQLKAEGNYIKNFYTDTFDIDMFSYMTRYFIILDIEGNPENGCNEVGAIITGYSVRNKFMIALKSFYFKREDFAKGLNDVVTLFKATLKDRNITYNYIDIYTFGSTDSYLFDNQLKESFTKTARKKYQKIFKFNDIQPSICNALDEQGIITVNRKQSSIAKAIGVEVAVPVHNALNDAVTLFNILAYLIRKGFHL